MMVFWREKLTLEPNITANVNTKNDLPGLAVDDALVKISYQLPVMGMASIPLTRRSPRKIFLLFYNRFWGMKCPAFI